jgi:isoaspartyl peptidase/L-asparaginase-like protein (Ntn-hydrolase superfamily)
MKDFKKMPKMACGGGVNKYGVGGSIVKALGKMADSPLATAGIFAPAVAATSYSISKDKEKAMAARQAADEAAKDKEADAKSAPAKKRGGTVRRNKK